MRRFARPLCFIACSSPFIYCLWQIYRYSNGLVHELGPDPGKAILHFNGLWAMILLLITLTITPARKILRLNLVSLRRMIGLFVFFYACLHLISYTIFLLELDFGNLAEDILERPYITVGMLAFCGLIPLAITSNQRMQRKLKRNWKRLHYLIYPIAICIIIHFLWQTRSDFTEPLVYGLILTLLLGYRVVTRLT